MSYASKVLYTGDGATKQFNIPFPFISTSHVQVFVNEALQLNPMHYTQSASTITFVDAPGVDAAIVIRRNTSPINPLVDFQNGSVLHERDLDTAYLHNFYLSQEYADSFNQLINDTLQLIASDAGIVETETDAIIAALVNEMLSQSVAADLQQRVNDIDANAEAILQLGTDLQVQINTLAEGVAAVVYVQDTEPVPGVGGVPDPITDGARWYDSDDDNHPYIYNQTSVEWVSVRDDRIGQAVADIEVLQTDVAGNAAAIIDEALARSTEDSALAATLGLLGAQNGGATAFILDTSTVKIDSDSGDTFASRFSQLAAADADNAAAITTIQSVDLANLEARYGVQLDVNGHVTGFVQNNDGTTGSFVIVADKFAIVDPDDEGVIYTPLQYAGGVLSLQNVEINGSLLINGSLVGSKLLAGTIGTTQIGANAITTTQLNANAVTAAKIAANAVTATKINVSELSAITANVGELVMNAAGHIRGGQTAYDVGTGFFLGYSGGEYKFSIGNASTALLWDGSNMFLRGATFTGAGLFLEDLTWDDTTGFGNGEVRFGANTGARKNLFWYTKNGAVVTEDHQWIFGTSSENFEVKFDKTSGACTLHPSSALAEDTWYDIATLDANTHTGGNAFWWYQGANNQKVVGTLTVRNKASTEVQASCTLNFTVDA